MSDVINLTYRPWMVGGIWFGVFLFFGLAAFFFATAYLAVGKLSALPLVALAAMGASMLYLATMGTKLLPYLRCSIRADENGFQVIRKDRTDSYSWSQSLTVRNSASIQILEIFDSNGNRIIAIDHLISNFDAFYALLTNE